MAFQTVDQWQVERHFLPANAVAWLPALPSNLPYRNEVQKLSNGGFALLLHGTFFYFLLSGLLEQDIDDPATAQSKALSSITMIEMGDAFEEDVTKPESSDPNEAAQLTSNVPAKMETSAKSELPPEWSRSRIAIAQPIVDPVETEIAIASETNSRNASGGAKGGGVYDPFAGAAPNRKPELEEKKSAPEPKPTLAGRITSYLGFGKETEPIGENAFEQWVASLRKRLPRAKGSVELSVTLDDTGKVKAGKIVGGSASQQVKFFVRNAVIGRKFPSSIVSSTNNKSTRLPMIDLG